MRPSVVDTNSRKRLISRGIGDRVSAPQGGIQPCPDRHLEFQGLEDPMLRRVELADAASLPFARHADLMKLDTLRDLQYALRRVGTVEILQPHARRT